jgi:hypothetical protein
MEAATARPLSSPRRLIEVETLVSAAHAHDLIAENAQLRRDLTSARLRNRTLIRAMNDVVTASEPIATIRGLATVSGLLVAARIAESYGEVPVIRFSRNDQGEIDGVSMALLEREDSGVAPLSESPVEFGGMAVEA